MKSYLPKVLFSPVKRRYLPNPIAKKPLLFALRELAGEIVHLSDMMKTFGVLKMKTACLAILMAFASVSLLSAQIEVEMKPISELPDNVKTADSELGMYVDWTPDENGQVKVFVVNRSDEAVTLRHAYGSVYAKIEAQNDEGDWERAESQAIETCGTGLGQFALKPGHWITQTHRINVVKAADVDEDAIRNEIEEIRDLLRRARLTKEAYDERMNRIAELEKQLAGGTGGGLETRKVRLRIYDANSRAFSNTGEAAIDPNQIELAKKDIFAIQFASTERLRAIILGTEEVEIVGPGRGFALSPVNTAIYALGNSTHSVEDVTDILQAFIEKEADENLVNMAKQKLEEIQNR